MIEIDKAFVDSVAPNANAIKNAHALILKNKIIHLFKSKDESLIFGECQGSGATNYYTSADFIALEKPVYRCTCPSRQFPCKHCLSLMYAYVDGLNFKFNSIPDDIVQKRIKLEKRVQKQPGKVNKSALKKKIKVQLEGLDLLETLTCDLIRAGLSNINAKTARQIEDQAKQLGDAYLTGAQAALHDFTHLFYDDNDKELGTEALENIYSEALDRLTRLHSLCRHGHKYLNNRLHDPNLAPEINTDIAAWLGHAWQLRELRELGLTQNDVELIQLAFNSYDHTARKQFIETGTWINLKNGHIQLTQNFRPYRAAKFIKEEDSFFMVAQVKELFIYPGDMNPRIRWDEMLRRPLSQKDFKTIRSLAKNKYGPVIKLVKNQLKSPLADKYPAMLLWYKRIGKAGDHLVMEDAGGEQLVFDETQAFNEPKSMPLLYQIPSGYLTDQALLVRFFHNQDTQKLRVKPLSIITASEILRLVY